jgi:hypothetical protein
MIIGEELIMMMKQQRWHDESLMATANSFSTSPLGVN